MSNGEDHQSFYSALYNALTDVRQVGVLLEHHRFQNRGRWICYKIAGKENGEDLFRETCLRVPQARGFGPDGIRNRNDFFGWFQNLACDVYVEKMRQQASMKNCTEWGGRWPDTLTAVSPEEMGQFLRHADVCPYHTEVLRAGEEQLRAVFRRARGLDSEGRLLMGRALRAAIAEHERSLKIWKEATRRRESPFNFIALYNGGKKIATCGKFPVPGAYQPLHELDPRAGLQIRGIAGGDTDRGVLLGSYALLGVSHDGDEEHLLDLDNGYNVGLKVRQLGEKNFEVYFRCVESRVIKEERSRADRGVIRDVTTGGPDADDSFTLSEPSNPLLFPGGLGITPGGGFPPHAGLPAGAFCFTLSALLLATATVGTLLLSGTTIGNVNANNLSNSNSSRPAHVKTHNSLIGGQTPEASPVKQHLDLRTVNSNSGGRASERHRATSPPDRPVPSATSGRLNPPPPGAAEERAGRPEAQGSLAVAAGSNAQPAATNVANNTAWAESVDNYTNHKTKFVLTGNLAIAGNELFMKKLFRQMRMKNMPAQFVEGQKSPSAKYMIEFLITPPKTEGARTTIDLIVDISRDGKSLDSPRPIAEFHGHNSDLVYEQAAIKAMDIIVEQLAEERESQSADWRVEDLDGILCAAPGRVGRDQCQAALTAAGLGAHGSVQSDGGRDLTGNNANQPAEKPPEVVVSPVQDTSENSTPVQ